ncbi:helix-turn-helix domain-containing protein [Shinella sp.]|uniref:helix-turn-helix domain-containing protein n=1 Tax=Shinella sp. TaxID=1870904 RepID=UPI0029A8D8B2|nr:helix-turn-helix domain-containing protein [Shinella sp.]MDX3973262.1 helix-turn-helix domain-containing protein [Shinella sp.]
MSTEALSRAINLAGGQKPLADLLGTTQSQIWYWLNRSKRGVPGEFASKVEVATGGAVTRHDLRPDIFGPQPENAA